MMSRRERERHVEARAAGRCAYCRMYQSLQGATFHVEHVVPQSRGGHSQLDNLVWACPSCNLHKANCIEATDPDTGNQVPLFHPRSDNWRGIFVGTVITLSVKRRSAERPLPHCISIIFDVSRFAKLKKTCQSYKVEVH